jgi:hypothetical protein
MRCAKQVLAHFQGRLHTAVAGVAGSCWLRCVPRGGCTLLRQEWLDPVRALPGEAANCGSRRGWILLGDGRSQGRLHTAEAGVAGSCGVVVQFQVRLHTAVQGWLDPVERGCALLAQEWLDPVELSCGPRGGCILLCRSGLILLSWTHFQGRLHTAVAGVAGSCTRYSAAACRAGGEAARSAARPRTSVRDAVSAAVSTRVHTGSCCASAILRGLLQSRSSGCVKQVANATLAATCRAGGALLGSAAVTANSSRSFLLHNGYTPRLPAGQELRLRERSQGRLHTA